MIAHLGLSFLIFIFPLVAAAVWKIRSIQRAAAKAERDALPFVPTSTPDPALLRGLPSARRIFLVQHLKAAAFLYLIESWTIAFIFTLPLFTLASVNSAKWLNHSAYLWYSFITGATHFTQFLTTMVLFSAIAAIMPRGSFLPHASHPHQLRLLDKDSLHLICDDRRRCHWHRPKLCSLLCPQGTHLAEPPGRHPPYPWP